MCKIEDTIDYLFNTKLLNEKNSMLYKISTIGLYTKEKQKTMKTIKDKAYCQGIINCCEFLLEEIGADR